MKSRLFLGVSFSCFSLFWGNSFVFSEPLTVQKNPVLLVQSSGNVVSSGTFVSGEHETKGTARIITENGKRYLELGEDFTTFNMGPDLVVILHRSEDVIGSTVPPAYPLKEGDYVLVAPLYHFFVIMQLLTIPPPAASPLTKGGQGGSIRGFIRCSFIKNWYYENLAALNAMKFRIILT